MKIHVLSKAEFDNLMKKNGLTLENVENKTDVFFISICGYDPLNDNEHYFSENKSNVLNLNFDDCEKDMVLKDISTKEDISMKAFTKEQAKELYNFLTIQKEKFDRKVCIVHCHAGISRSSACGLIVNEIYGEDYKKFKYDNPQIHPNQLVVRLMHEVMRGDDYEKSLSKLL